MMRKKNQARLNAMANEQMLLSFHRQAIETQMVKEGRHEREAHKHSIDQGQEYNSTTGGAEPRSNLFLKNASSNIAPRRQQLAISQTGIPEDTPDEP